MPSTPSSDVLFDRDEDGRVIARIRQADHQADEVLRWVGFHPTNTTGTYALPGDMGRAEARECIMRASHILWAIGRETLTDATLDDITNPDQDLTHATHAVNDVADQLQRMWHPGEVAWHLHCLAGTENSLLAAVHTLVEQTQRWCQDSNSHLSEELGDAITILDQARHLIAGVSAQLHHAADPPSAHEGLTTPMSHTPPPPTPHSSTNPRRPAP